MGFPRQEYWRGLAFHSPEDLPDPGTQPESPDLTGWLLSGGLKWYSFHLQVVHKE